MKVLQIGTFRKVQARGFWLRRKVRVLKRRRSVRKGALANTRIPDAPTRGRASRQPKARSLIAIDGIAPALLLSRGRGRL